MPIRIVKDEDTKREKGLKKSKMLSGGQAKLDKNKNNKIDAEDFALLRKEKSKAKPMKAKRGKFSDVMGKSSAIKTAPGSIASKAEVKQGTKKLGKFMPKKIKTIGALLGAAGAGAVGQKLIDKMKKKNKKMGGGMMKKYSKGGGADTGTAGEGRSKRAVTIDNLNRATKTLRNAVTARGQAAKNFVNRVKADVRDSGKTKMMGGGMMQRPMGMMRPMGMAKKGKMIKARGGGMAKTKPTSMY